MKIEDLDRVWNKIQGLRQGELEPINEYNKKFSLLWESLCEALQPQVPPLDMKRKERFLGDL